MSSSSPSAPHALIRHGSHLRSQQSAYCFSLQNYRNETGGIGRIPTAT
ncbi:hypothetical protein PENARI_c050G12567 [Penicillium arizonense]|uniref:Uncharacterized protein n=1 Tax=Penicillium arizonense TaxID=1835702 RepID=A0A1F5L246_PENAI|nr:hypothetical protein PENARI_c050G12567 [Penicillium arizonense]OGE47303.1 hypothetical protein PENARI_c050G12567 [Penicillium arizonense]